MKKSFFILLTLIFTPTAFAQTFKWAKQLGSTGNDNLSQMVLNGSNMLIEGSYTGTVDFDLGPGVYNHSSGGGRDGFLANYDTSGNLQWIYFVEGSLDDYIGSYSICSNGDIILIGSFKSTIDFDPGPGVVSMSAGGLPFVFIVRLSSSGNFIWAKSFGGFYDVFANSLSLDNNDNIYLCGSFDDVTDFDPGPGTYNLTPSGSLSDGYILKLDPSGNFSWAYKFGSNSNESANRILATKNNELLIFGTFANTVDFDPGPGIATMSSASLSSYLLKFTYSGTYISVTNMGDEFLPNMGMAFAENNDGSIFFYGQFTGTADMDPGPSVYNITSSGSYDAYFGKLDSAGNFLWGKSFGGAGSSDAISSIKTDNLGFIYISGVYDSQSDLDPGPGIYTIPGYGLYDCLISKFDLIGNFLWSHGIGGPGYDYGYSIDIDPIGNIYQTGQFENTVDMNHDGGTFNLTSTGMGDGFIRKLGQNICSYAGLLFDSVSNVKCVNQGFAAVHAFNSVGPHNYSWNTNPVVTDSSISIPTSGIYTVSMTDANNCSVTRSVIISAPVQTSAFDLNANLSAGSFQTGFPSYVSLNALNDGCIPATGQLKLKLSPLVIFNNSSPAPDIISGDTLIWNFTSLTYDSMHLTPFINLTTSVSAAINQQVCFDVIITPITGDANTINNVKEYCFPIINSYDPNDKQVFPKGECNAGYVTMGTTLTYTVRFQNTGNTNAVNIKVLDSLSQHLDINSLRVVGNSHAVYAEALTNNTVAFHFDNIMLPDSSTNEPASHGYVVFEIAPLISVLPATLVENKVGIYFDFNTPIITNTVHNTYVSSIPVFSSTQNISMCTGDSITTSMQTYNTPGTYIENLTTPDGCDSTLTINLSVDSINTNVIAFGNDTLISLFTNASSYQWINCDNNTILSGAINSIFEAQSNGNFAVILSKNTCIDTSLCYLITGIGITELFHNKELIVFPNPVNNNFTITLPTNILNAEISIINSSGETILQQQNTSGNNLLFNCEHYNSGVYFILIKELSGNIYIARFIK